MAGLRGVVLLLGLVLVVGCGSHSAAGPVVPCVSVPLVGANETVLAPPPPRIVSARQHGQEMTVDIEIPATPDECKPVAYHAKVTSTADQSNDGVQPANQTGGDMPLHSRHLHIVFRPPILRLPPYVAIAALVARNGVDSKAARRLFPQNGDYCLRHHSKSLCLIRAHYEALRCMHADVPRTHCTAWSYGSERPWPVVPVTGATPAAVQKNLRELLAKGTYNDVRLTALHCTQRLVCVGTFSRRPAEGIMRVRYVLTGYRQKPGCWITSRTDVLYPPPDRVRSPFEGLAPQGKQSWCLSWRNP